MNFRFVTLLGILTFLVSFVTFAQPGSAQGAAELQDFIGFETGGLEEAIAASGSPAVNSTAPVRSGTYSLKLPGATTPAVYSTPASSESFANRIVGFAFRTNDVVPTNDVDFLQAIDTTPNTLMRLRLKASTGNVDLIDSNNGVAGTITAPFSINTWYFIEVLWQAFTDPGTAEVFIDDNTALSVSGQDFLASPIVPTGYQFTGNNTASEDIIIEDFYSLSDDIIRYTSLFNVPRTYQDTNGGSTELGDVLAVGTWADASETLGNDTNQAEYTADPSTGGTTTDSPSSRLGPTGGPTLGTIKGAKWIHRLDRDGGGASTHWKRYGNSTDGMTDTTVSLTTSPANYFTISESGTIVPLTSESFQYGMRVNGAQDIHAYDIWAMIANITAAAPTRRIFQVE